MSSNMNCDDSGIQNCSVGVVESNDQSSIDGNDTIDEVKTSDLSNTTRLSTDESALDGFDLLSINNSDEQPRSRPPPLDIVHRQGSGSSTKTCEVDCEEEKDTFSPVSNSSSPSELAQIGEANLQCIGSGDKDNKLFEKQIKHVTPSSAVSTTKEEKQRQNEEIVIMETSSISSETGSWESIFPNQGKISAADVRKCCNDFLHNERTNYYGGLGKSTNIGACFIDASSLRDEEEGPLSYSSLDTAVIAHNIGTHQLESFHKTFKFCKGTRPTTSIHDNVEDSSKISNSSDESFDKPKDSDQASNLSDEEKLSRKRDNTNCDSLGGAVAGSSTHLFESSKVDNGEEQDCLSSSSDSNEAINLRKEKERKQGQFVFQHNIQELSRHVISPKPPFQSDTNYTTDYSSSSPVASLVWSSETEKNPKSSSCVLPETPHNSIVQVHTRIEYRDSGAYCSDATESPIPLPRTPKRFSKFDEANPIVSGGASVQDFNTKPCESPVVRRKTESCPIVSGGFMSLDFERASHDEDEFKVKPKMRNTQAQGVSSWVVDMSDCKITRDVNNSSEADNSLKNGVGYFIPITKSVEQENKQKEDKKIVADQNIKKPTGFYVDLSGDDDSCNATPPPSLSGQTPSNKESNDRKNIFSMFIDFGEKKIISKKEPMSLANRLSNSFYMKKGTNDDLMKSSTSSTETLMSKSSQQQPSDGDSKYVEETRKEVQESVPTTVAAIRRISNKFTSSNDPKRHSWTNNASYISSSTSDCKRSMSLTGDKGLMHIIDKIPLISKTCSVSVDSSLSPFDDFTSSKSEIGSTCSNNSITSGSGGDGADQGNTISATFRIKKRRKDVQLNETFDKSSLASITDGVFSKDISPTSTGTDTEDLTFQQEEEVTENGQSQMIEVSNRPLVMETIIEAKETFSPKKSALSSSSTHTMESLNATIEKQKQLLETVSENAATESHAFVKLSDMDKPMATKFELHSPSDAMSRSVGNHRHINRLFHESSRTRPHSWTMTRSSGPSILNITSSVDNLRSLSRLFPQFSKEFSSSLPNDFAGNAELLDYANSSDFSINSSLTSSFSRSGMDESSISYRQPRRLGEDLLKMFLQEIATDMTVEVNGRRIKAHKCILRSRCQYFAAMLAGGWAQNSGNVVSLPGYSYSAVHFALCHIYSGASHPPDGISLMELAALADLLGLEGLKEVTAHALKNNYCHNFHKPCSGCIDGILQVLPVALNHALDDLYRKCLKWACRHYLKVWPTRSFAQLPTDILFRCRQQIVAYLTSETVLGTVLDCDNLLAQLAPFRWASVIENLVRDILDVSYGYIADHFSSLIASDSFLSLGHDKSSHIPRLESLLLRTASSLTSDQACRSYQRITRLNTVLSAKLLKMPHLSELAKELQGIHEEELEWNEDFIRLIGAILSAVEQCLTRQCSRAMRVNAWQRMDLELRKKIQTLARLTEPLDLRRGKAVAKAFSFNGSSNRSQDLYQVKLAIQAHSKRVLANDSHLYKATTHTQTHVQEQNIQTAERGVQASHDINDFMGKVLKTNSRVHVPLMSKLHTNQTEKSSSHRRTQSEASVVRTSSQQVKNKAEPTVARLSDVRPRYLEPRKPRGVENSAGPVRSQTSSSMPSSVAKGKHISSSDSSRNSSPAIRKNATSKEGKIGTKSANMSLDSLASPSRKTKAKNKSDQHSDVCVDSLAESMKTSMATNKTISQESLNGGKLSRSNPIISNKLATRQTKTQPMPKAFSNRPLAKGRQFSSQTTTSAGSSPSSITNKSGSRLSSVSSVNSPRDVFKNRSISVPGNSNSATNTQATPTVARKSFLSAKSREILARRAEKNKQQQNQKLTSCTNDKNKATLASSKPQSLLRVNAGRETVPNSNRNSLPSNIPTRRPNSLHLKKTNIVEQKNANNQYQELGETKTKSKNAITNGIDTIELSIENLSSKGSNLIESKLERSSTFCKESSDLLDSKELQAIE